MKMTTHEVAEHMVATGKAYTAAMLVSELGIAFNNASGALYNIRLGKRYQTQVSELPGRTVRVISVDGFDQAHTTTQLWRLAIFGTPLEVA